MKRIAVLTSGGDSPGMNAAIRSIVLTAEFHSVEVFGVLHGFDGLINNEFKVLSRKEVNGIISHGGTILRSARSKGFMTSEGRKSAFLNLKKNEIDALIVLGGDGSFRGALQFDLEYNFPTIGLPCTIDNDLKGTDFCIGYDTAINTAMEAIDKIRDTANSHDRVFFIEVMGRDAGLIALSSGIAGGAESILIPETKTTVDELIDTLKKDRSKEMNSMLVVVAEGDEEGGAQVIADKVKKQCPDYDVRVTILGHIQRGGRPSCSDRVLATRLGLVAVEKLLVGVKNCSLGIVNNQITESPFSVATKEHPEIDAEIIHLINVLAN